jgi:hypothetical protein
MTNANNTTMNDQAIYNEFTETNGFFDYMLPCGNVLVMFSLSTKEIRAQRTDKASATVKVLATGLRLLSKNFAFETTFGEALETIMNEYNENPAIFCRY